MPVRAVIVTVVVALAAPAAGASAAAPDQANCPKSGKVAKIGGKNLCLANGRACSKTYNKHYRKHGYTCSKGRLKKVKQEF